MTKQTRNRARKGLDKMHMDEVGFFFFSGKGGRGSSIHVILVLSPINK
jgi:hypothetical protein